jgi:hypothetical protein
MCRQKRLGIGFVSQPVNRVAGVQGLIQGWHELARLQYTLQRLHGRSGK